VDLSLEKWVEIDLSKVGHDDREIKRYLRPHTIFMAVVKGDAYEHGMKEISQVALDNGADWLCDCMEFKTKIIFTKEVGPGSHVGYENMFIADEKKIVGLIPVRYVERIPTSLANQGYVLIRGRKLPLVGSVCFGHSFVNLTSLSGEASIGDEVVLIGTQGNESISYRDIAGKVNVEKTETFLRITRTVSRLYKGVAIG
jgi:alanine racemase